MRMLTWLLVAAILLFNVQQQCGGTAQLELVHFSWVNFHPKIFRHRLSLLHYASVMSVVKYLKPVHIYFWCVNEPNPLDEWWQLIKPLVVVKRIKVEELSILPTSNHLENGDISDLLGMIKLKEFGGLYVNWETIFINNRVLKLLDYPAFIATWPHDNLRQALCGVVYSKKPQQPFFVKWMSLIPKNRQDLGHFMNIVSYELWEKHPNLIIMLPAKMFYSPEISDSFVTDFFITKYEEADSHAAEPVNCAIRVWLTSSFWHYSFHSLEDVEDVFARFTRFHSILRKFLHSLRCVPISWHWERTCIIKPESKYLISSKPFDPVIPRLIHSSWKNKVPENEGLFYAVISWKVRNPDYELKIWVDDEMDCFVKRHFPAYYQIYSNLPHVIYKADFFRYLVVYVYGGFYSDIDTETTRPLDELIPNWRNEGISAFIAVEEDNTFGYKGNRHPGTARVIQLCQWTFAFSPKHPLLLYIIERVYSQLEVVSKYNLFKIGVLELTGPGIWTDLIFEYLRAKYPSDFPKIEQARNPIKFGTDLVILPVVYFTTVGHGVHHFHDRDERNFVRHGFQGSWRYGKFMIPMGDHTKEFIRRQYIDIKANWFL